MSCRPKMRRLFAKPAILMLPCTLTACGATKDQRPLDPPRVVREGNLSEGWIFSMRDERKLAAAERTHVPETWVSATGTEKGIALHRQSILETGGSPGLAPMAGRYLVWSG